MEFFTALEALHKRWPRIEQDPLRKAFEAEVDELTTDLKGSGRQRQYATAVQGAYDNLFSALSNVHEFSVSFDDPASIVQFLTRTRYGFALIVLAAKAAGYVAGELYTTEVEQEAYDLGGQLTLAQVRSHVSCRTKNGKPFWVVIMDAPEAYERGQWIAAAFVKRVIGQ